MRIAVYSGSFNPLHIGHLAIMRYLTEEAGFDQVYLVVSPKNPIKDSIDPSTAEDRLRAAREAVDRHPGLKVVVDDIELHMPPPQYTILTLDALKAREPWNDFTLVIGADNLGLIRRWRDYRRILVEYGVAVFPRTGTDSEEIRRTLMLECAGALHGVPGSDGEDGPDPGTQTLHPGMYRIRLLEAPKVDMSSTFIREGLARGEDMSAYLM